MAFEIDGTVIDLLYCHCSMCRKAHGSAFRARGKVRASEFRWVRGEELVRYYQSSPGQHRGFCSVCGSNLLTKFDETPRVLGLALGVLDDDPGNRPICHVFVGSKAPWHEITDALPRFEQGPTGPVTSKAVYLVAQLSIHDRETYAKYASDFMEVFNPYGGKLLSVEEAPEVLEGEWGYTRTVLLEFPSQERAHAWYGSAQYQAIAHHRRAASVANVVFIRGR